MLREDYSPDNFVDGPLLQAMREGGFLYIEEFNRAPEDTLNTLLTAMAERQIAVPTAGIVTAAPTFRVVASMNPYDNVGTTRLSTSVHDRHLPAGHRLPGRGGRARHRRAAGAAASVAPELYQRLVADAVAVTRATREHPDIRQGSSVRGAIDLTLVAGQLLELRGPRRPRLPGAGVRRDGGRAVRPDLPGRDRRGDAGGGAAADLGGPVHPGSRPRRRLVEERCRPTRRCGGPGPYGRHGWRRCGAGPSSSTRTPQLFEAAAAAGPGAWS